MKDGKNLALVATRQVTRPQFEHAYVSRHIIEIKACSHDRNTQIFPLFISDNGGELAFSSGATPNLNTTVLTKLAKALGLKFNSSIRSLGKDSELSPLRLFNFAYAILHCPSYRERYFEFLRSDFPRLPLTANLELFRALARFGGELIALHLLESKILDKPAAKFKGKNHTVSKVGWTTDNGGTVWLDGKGAKGDYQAGTSGFNPVPEKVWNFHIGGYQVCEKWLKDRGPKKGQPGRTLTDEDILHYRKVVMALGETIQLMKEIHEEIENHGGWPGAFIAPENESKPASPAIAAVNTEYKKQVERIDPDMFDQAAESDPEDYE